VWSQVQILFTRPKKKIAASTQVEAELFKEAIHQARLNGRANENNSKPTRGIFRSPLLATIFMLLH